MSDTKFDALLGRIRESDLQNIAPAGTASQSTSVAEVGGSPSAFITEGATGITTIRWASTPSATLYDMTINDAGAVVTTAVSAGGSFDFIDGTEFQFVDTSYFDFVT